MSTKLIVGLGNPGKQYDMTKHNVGFSVIDKICEKRMIVLVTEKFNGVYNKTTIDGQSVIIAKPLTFMNLSGHFVSQIMSYFDISSEDVLVIYDDVDTEIGDLRIKPSGSSGGQNGIKNIIEQLGTEKIKRIRIGIGKSQNIPLASYVLSKFTPEQQKKVDPVIEKAASLAMDFVSKPFEKLQK